jgi:hypothetical protein
MRSTHRPSPPRFDPPIAAHKAAAAFVAAVISKNSQVLAQRQSIGARPADGAPFFILRKTKHALSMPSSKAIKQHEEAFLGPFGGQGVACHMPLKRAPLPGSVIIYYGPLDVPRWRLHRLRALGASRKTQNRKQTQLHKIYVQRATRNQPDARALFPFDQVWWYTRPSGATGLDNLRKGLLPAPSASSSQLLLPAHSSPFFRRIFVLRSSFFQQ